MSITQVTPHTLLLLVEVAMTSRFVLLSACKASNSSCIKKSIWFPKNFSRGFCGNSSHSASTFPLRISSWSSSSSSSFPSSSSRSFSASSNGDAAEEDGGEHDDDVVESQDTPKMAANGSKKTEKPGRKMRKPKDKRYIVQSQRARNSDLEVRAQESGLGWREVVAW